jgi:hypothetical protein
MESLGHGQSQVIPETGFDALWGSAALNSLGPDRARSRPRRRRAIRPRGLPGGLARYGVKNVRFHGEGRIVRARYGVKNVRFHGEGRIVRRQAGDFATEAFSPGGEPRIRGDTMDEVGGGVAEAREPPSSPAMGPLPQSPLFVMTRTPEHRAGLPTSASRLRGARRVAGLAAGYWARGSRMVAGVGCADECRGRVRHRGRLPR